MYFLYNLFAILTAPVWLVWMWIRTSRRAEKPDWRERTGNYGHIQIPKDQPAIWIHAVSVGEVMAVLPVLSQVKALVPEAHLVLSVTTSSGHHTAREHAVGLYDSLVYFPIDLARFQLSAMMRIRPEVVAIMETELWFNFLWAAKAVGARTLLINGRISDRSFPRSRKLTFFYRPLLAMIDACLMQTEVDAERIKVLGAPRVEVVGNVKFDQAIDGLDADVEQWREALGLRSEWPTIVVGSTRGEEEELFVAQGIESLASSCNIVWAPRHLERVPQLVELLRDRLKLEPALRSEGGKGQIVILDTYGELSRVYSVADAVIIGGGFANLGGQNLIQALAHGKPVIHGPHMQNFKDVALAAERAGATLVVSTPEELGAELSRLLSSRELCRTMGQAGAALVQKSAGASRTYASRIAEGVDDD